MKRCKGLYVKGSKECELCTDEKCKKNCKNEIVLTEANYTILRRLLKGPASASELSTILSKKFGTQGSSTYYHLAELRKMGIIQCRGTKQNKRIELCFPMEIKKCVDCGLWKCTKPFKEKVLTVELLVCLSEQQDVL